MATAFATMTVANLWTQGADLWTLLQGPVMLVIGIAFVAAIARVAVKYGMKIANATRR